MIVTVTDNLEWRVAHKHRQPRQSHDRVRPGDGGRRQRGPRHKQPCPHGSAQEEAGQLMNVC